MEHISPSVEEALQEQALAIWEAYRNGNKSTARAMLRLVDPKRIAYATLWVLWFAEREDNAAGAAKLIYSITQ